MGADIERHRGRATPTGPEPVGDLVVRGGATLRAIRIEGARVADLIDELPLLAIAMAAAEGRSELRDAGELRVKESDRIALVVDGLQAIGVDAEELPRRLARDTAAAVHATSDGPDGRDRRRPSHRDGVRDRGA